MFDLFDPDLFTEIVQDHFSVLDARYVADLCRELLPDLQETFDAAYEMKFLILDADTGKPINANAVLSKREAAEEFLNIVGPDKHTIGILLIES
jgi:hypothetical protein